MVSIILMTSIQAKSQVRGPMPDPDHRVIKYYPNPAVSFITFEIAKESNKTFNLQIYSFLGKLVKYIPDVSDKTTVQLSDLTRGLYTFQLKDESGRVTDSGIFQLNK